jgi:hypothetical protein
LWEQQDADFNIVKQHFEAAGIAVLDLTNKERNNGRLH